MDSAQSQLLGYLLGALDEPEQDLVEARLQFDPQWRRELARLRAQLARLEPARAEFAPPPGLGERACAAVFDRPAAAAARAALTTAAAPPVAAPRARWTDLVAAASILAAAAMLVFPAVQSSRFRAQVTACQDNLRDLSVALTGYSENHNGYFPSVPTRGRKAAAGIYAPTLARNALLDESRRVLCPGSPLAGRGDFRLLDLDELDGISETALEQFRPMLGGSYGYSLGHLAGGVYRDTRNLRRPFFAILADAPSATLPGRSVNHGGRGENVLFEDGRVRFVTCRRPLGLDDIFCNDRGQVLAGLHANDAVIAPSAAAPLPDDERP